MAIDSVFDIGDHLRLSNWEFFFSTDSDIKFKVRSVTLPRFKLTHEALKNGLKNYTGVAHVETVTIEFYEDVNFSVDTFLQGLMDKVYDAENHVFRVLKSETVFPDGVLNLYKGTNDTETTDTLARTYYLQKMKILGIEDSSFSYEDSGPLIYSVSFTIESLMIKNAEGDSNGIRKKGSSID